MRLVWTVLAWAAAILAVLFLLSMLFNHAAHAAPGCLRYADVVGGSHPTWSGRVPGHRGEHCWFPDRHSRFTEQRHQVDKRGHLAESGHSSVAELQSSKLVVAGSIPAARSTLTIAEQQRSITFPYFKYAMVVFERWFQPTLDWTSDFDDLFAARARRS